ncbi:MAG: hypothetical protein WBJ50_05470, partial [Smithellaceae bacterium]
MRFLRKSETIWRTTRAYDGSFLQPIAVGLVSAILVALILIMGFLDMRRGETNLIGLMEDQAFSTVAVLQRLTEENHKRITARAPKSPLKEKSAREEEDDFIKKYFSEAITALTWKLYYEHKKQNIIDNEYLKKFAADNHLWYVGILDRQGNAIFQSRDLLADEAELLPGGINLTTLT